MNEAHPHGGTFKPNSVEKASYRTACPVRVSTGLERERKTLKAHACEDDGLKGHCLRDYQSPLGTLRVAFFQTPPSFPNCPEPLLKEEAAASSKPDTSQYLAGVVALFHLVL